jgi:cellulose synthase/poly-beta-1,6-N-acetylglucosamine synthase-like glycosyltransferase
MLAITTLIPTYRRTGDLVRCLEALKGQTRLPNQVLLVIRDTDTETWSFLATFDPTPLSLQLVTVTLPGQVAALNTGLEATQGDIIAITDDDAAPHPDWLERIEKHFIADAAVGGVGGRDWVYQGTQLEDGASDRVGRVQWFGRTVGNHHIGRGAARSVEILKGANMSYRRSAIQGLRFNSQLRGTGAQVHNDLGFSLAVKQRGWTLIYDPAVAVDHYPAQRFDEDKREQFSPLAFMNQVHNETLVLLGYLPFWRRWVFLVWAVLVGNRVNPGLVQVLRLFPKEGLLVAKKWWAMLAGRWQGWHSWRDRDWV